MTSPHTRRPDALWTVVLGGMLSFGLLIFGIACALVAVGAMMGVVG
jgi:hypothetical protein